MKKVLLATAVVMAMGSTSAMATEGGRINFEGLVSAETCQKVVTSSVGSSETDGTVTLNTAHVSDITAEVADTTAGAKAEDFSIKLDCSEAGADLEKASLTLSSSFSNTKGTLDNDETLSRNGEAAAKAVDIAIHRVADDTNALSLVKINDPANTMDQEFTNNVATYNFKASYVKSSDAGAEVTTGPVTTNAIYTFSYQ
ncbi:TPA: fimbrial protein [Salmonella enterica]|nr:fimbrial protein [Salmonella enterica]ECE5991208.1 fimbrial protein [Salmonella enterica subsp. salamae]EEJ9247870.1 fimbrial protein [Salmonella enterica subsp. enterica serovar Muenchen]ECE6744676.1 fimbrial protein [Salmonella enterica subsp. salamae]ECG0941465.1 fimbrial protein [Salmonella enterica subsp. salamae]